MSNLTDAQLAEMEVRCDSIGDYLELHDLRQIVEQDVPALLAEVRRLREAEKWHPISTAPRDGTHILTCDKWQHMVAVSRWTSSYSRDGWYTRGENSYFQPDFWKPIPKSLKEHSE